jgi:hypothetical protein
MKIFDFAMWLFLWNEIYVYMYLFYLFIYLFIYLLPFSVHKRAFGTWNLPEGIKKNTKYSFVMVFGSRFEPCTSRIKITSLINWACLLRESYIEAERIHILITKSQQKKYWKFFSQNFHNNFSYTCRQYLWQK